MDCKQLCEQLTNQRLNTRTTLYIAKKNWKILPAAIKAKYVFRAKKMSNFNNKINKYYINGGRLRQRPPALISMQQFCNFTQSSGLFDILHRKEMQRDNTVCDCAMDLELPDTTSAMDCSVQAPGLDREASTLPSTPTTDDVQDVVLDEDPVSR
jgi:hypothetical protein